MVFICIVWYIVQFVPSFPLPGGTHRLPPSSIRRGRNPGQELPVLRPRWRFPLAGNALSPPLSGRLRSARSDWLPKSPSGRQVEVGTAPFWRLVLASGFVFRRLPLKRLDRNGLMFHLLLSVRPESCWASLGSSGATGLWVFSSVLS